MLRIEKILFLVCFLDLGMQCISIVTDSVPYLLQSLEFNTFLNTDNLEYFFCYLLALLCMRNCRCIASAILNKHFTKLNHLN